MPSPVADLFDAMADAYDEVEPWYEHLYALLHAVLRREIGAAPAGGGRALDAGCGTGFQTALLAELGWRSHGIDIAGGLLSVARRRLPDTALVRGTVEAMPYGDACFDVVVCCGSTLSFVDDPDHALAEIARVLRPGGHVLLECEHRPSLDLAWSLASALVGDPLGYGVTVGEAWRAMLAPGDVRVSYPGYGPLRLFGRRALHTRLVAAGLIPVRTWGLHAITNLIPSTVLHRPRLSRGLASLYRALRRLDAALVDTAPARALANSLVVLAERAQPSA
jgi:MPBQ/MSBQ methyltransferase